MDALPNSLASKLEALKQHPQFAQIMQDLLGHAREAGIPWAMQELSAQPTAENAPMQAPAAPEVSGNLPTAANGPQTSPEAHGMGSSGAAPSGRQNNHMALTPAVPNGFQSTPAGETRKGDLRTELDESPPLQAKATTMDRNVPETRGMSPSRNGTPLGRAFKAYPRRSIHLPNTPNA